MSLVMNKKAGFNYELLEKLQAGIELLGFEVKAVRNSQGSLEGAYVIVRGGEVFLVNADIPPYQSGNTPASYSSRRNRKLLLTKREIHDLSKIDKKKGLTIVPISMYNKGRNIKVEIAVGKGKKQFDKRESIKTRETERDMRRQMKGH